MNNHNLFYEMCRGFVEIVCKGEMEDLIQSLSFRCLRNIPDYGFAKCFPSEYQLITKITISSVAIGLKIPIFH